MCHINQDTGNNTAPRYCTFRAACKGIQSMFLYYFSLRIQRTLTCVIVGLFTGDFCQQIPLLPKMLFLLINLSLVSIQFIIKWSMTSIVIECHIMSLLCLKIYFFSYILFFKSLIFRNSMNANITRTKIFIKLSMTSKVIEGHTRPLMLLCHFYKNFMWI